MPPARPQNLPAAKALRQKATEAEEDAWELLRDRRTFGLKFRRQQPLFGYIADFYCAAHKLCIELDGAPHLTAEGKLRDNARDMRLERAGIKVIRIFNGDLGDGRKMRARLRRFLNEKGIVPEDDQCKRMADTNDGTESPKHRIQ